MGRIEHIGDATLYLSDCLEILPTLGPVDAVVTDPPYGISLNVKRHRWSGEKIEWKPVHGDEYKFNPLPWLQFSNLILWGATYYSDQLPVGDWLLWDKRGGNPILDRMIGDSFEIAWMRGKGKIHIMRLLHGGVVNADSIMGNNSQREHPTQKPVGIMSWCLGFYPNSKIILDPYMGSGTTGVACAKLGRKFIGIEIEPKYFDIACKRIETEYAQLKMF
jgi:site-specific DNA-methyltransferase (adenine-specific)/modification methylase